MELYTEEDKERMARGLKPIVVGGQTDRSKGDSQVTVETVQTDAEISGEETGRKS